MPNATSRLTVDDVRTWATLSAQQTASLLDCSDDLVYDAIKRGDIPAVWMGRKVFVKTKELLELLGQDAA